MPLHFIIISVPEDIPRRNHVLAVKQKLENISSSCEIFDGVYWKTNDVLKKLNDEKIALLPIGDSYAITQSQIGCFLSHYLVWKKIAESHDDDKYIILEDDMDLSDDFNFSELLDTLDTPYDTIILWKHPARQQDYEKIPLYNKYLKTFYSQWGTTAYSITKEFAKTLVDSINSISKPLDLILHDDIYPKHPKVYVCLKEHFVNLGDLGSGENPKLKFKSLIFS